MDQTYFTITFLNNKMHQEDEGGQRGNLQAVLGKPVKQILHLKLPHLSTKKPALIRGHVDFPLPPVNNRSSERPKWVDGIRFIGWIQCFESHIPPPIITLNVSGSWPFQPDSTWDRRTHHSDVNIHSQRRQGQAIAFRSPPWRTQPFEFGIGLWADRSHSSYRLGDWWWGGAWIAPQPVFPIAFSQLNGREMWRSHLMWLHGGALPMYTMRRNDTMWVALD